MNCYEKLKAYFPGDKMRSKKHMKTLLKEKDDVYYKDESWKHGKFRVPTFKMANISLVYSIVLLIDRTIDCYICPLTP